MLNAFCLPLSLFATLLTLSVPWKLICKNVWMSSLASLFPVACGKHQEIWGSIDSLGPTLWHHQRSGILAGSSTAGAVSQVQWPLLPQSLSSKSISMPLLLVSRPCALVPCINSPLVKRSSNYPFWECCMCPARILMDNVPKIFSSSVKRWLYVAPLGLPFFTSTSLMVHQDSRKESLAEICVELCVEPELLG